MRTRLLSRAHTCATHLDAIVWDGAGWFCAVHWDYADTALAQTEPAETFTVAPLDPWYAESTAMWRRPAVSNHRDAPSRERVVQRRRELREDVRSRWEGALVGREDR